MGRRTRTCAEASARRSRFESERHRCAGPALHDVRIEFELRVVASIGVRAGTVAGFRRTGEDRWRRAVAIDQDVLAEFPWTVVGDDGDQYDETLHSGTSRPSVAENRTASSTKPESASPRPAGWYAHPNARTRGVLPSPN